MSARNHLGVVGGAALVLVVGAGIWLGSHGLRHFDPAVIGYAIGTLLAAFAVGYRFVTWAQRPPSRMYFKRGLQLLFQRGAQVSKPESLWDCRHNSFFMSVFFRWTVQIC